MLTGVFLALFLLLVLLAPDRALSAYRYIDWRTVFSLAGLLVATKGIEESGVFDPLVRHLLSSSLSERSLALTLVYLSALLAAFVTNDVALFIIVPLILQLSTVSGLNSELLLALSVISVNVGSSLTPIGNPQNIFIWHSWGVSFIRFCIAMLFPFVLCIFFLFLLCFLLFENAPVSCVTAYEKSYNFRILLFSVCMLVLYVVVLDMDYIFLPTIALVACFAFVYPRVLRKVDWSILLMFIFVFMDFGVILRLGLVHDFVTKIVHKFGVFIASVVLSQFVSNVPATILVSGISHDWIPIAYGVNIGGNGLMVASFANLIALHLYPKRKFFVVYHAVSIPFLIATSCLVWLCLKHFLH